MKTWREWGIFVGMDERCFALAAKGCGSAKCSSPCQVGLITDKVRDTTAVQAANEKFQTPQGAGFGEVLRGVSWTPGTRVTNVANGGFGR